VGRPGIEHRGVGRGRRKLTEPAAQGSILEEGRASGGCEHGRVDGLAQVTEQPLDAGGGDVAADVIKIGRRRLGPASSTASRALRDFSRRAALA
jgi:hypothetical protein